MSKGPWIPSGEQDYVDLCNQWKTELSKPGLSDDYNWDKDAVIGVMGPIHSFLEARAAYKEDNSSNNRKIKDDAKKVAQAAMRDFANTSIRFNKKMSAAQKAVFGISEPDRTLTGTMEINSFPESETNTSILRQVGILYWDSATKRRRKPHGVHEMEIRWAILANPPKNVEELINVDSDTASPFTLHFSEEDRGKRLYYCLRWVSKRKVKGPFGEIRSAVIP